MDNIKMLMDFITPLTALIAGLWFLWKQLSILAKQIDNVADNLRDYQIRNDNTVQKEHERISFLSRNSEKNLSQLDERLTEIENYLASSNDYSYIKRARNKTRFNDSTSGDWTQL